MTTQEKIAAEVSTAIAETIGLERSQIPSLKLIILSAIYVARKPLVDALKGLRRVNMTRDEMKSVIDAALAKEGKQ